jgi:hypothetical protein
MRQQRLDLQANGVRFVERWQDDGESVWRHLISNRYHSTAILFERMIYS